MPESNGSAGTAVLMKLRFAPCFGLLAVFGLFVYPETLRAQPGSLSSGRAGNGSGSVLALDGSPQTGVIVQLLQAPQTNLLETVMSNEAGQYQFVNVGPG